MRQRSRGPRLERRGGGGLGGSWVVLWLVGGGWKRKQARVSLRPNSAVRAISPPLRGHRELSKPEAIFTITFKKKTMKIKKGLQLFQQKRQKTLERFQENSHNGNENFRNITGQALDIYNTTIV